MYIFEVNDASVFERANVALLVLSSFDVNPGMTVPYKLFEVPHDTLLVVFTVGTTDVYT